MKYFSTLVAATAAAQVFDPAAYSSSAPVYPTRLDWSAAFSKAEAFLSNLTLTQKVALVTGIQGPCVGNVGPVEGTSFRGLCHQDGPTAFRLASLVSLFPSGITTAASWDTDLAYQRGLELGQEFKGKGVHVGYGPVVGPIGRNVLSGRVWEGFGPDPYLSGQLAAASVRGMQDGGVQAVTKHLVGNEQETQRMPSINLALQTVESVSSNIDDRTMHELYLWAFADAIRAGTAGIMCSYNRLNSSYACQNSKVINGLLKDEMAFQGFVVSDYGAVHAGVATANSGLDQNMPGGMTGITTRPSVWDASLVQAVQNGSVAESRVDDMVLRVLTPYFQLGQDSADFPRVDASTIDMTPVPNPPVDTSLLGGTFNRDVRADHAALIRQLGASATVLLKNTDNTLPLDRPSSIAIFGDDQGDPTQAVPNSLGSYSYGTLPVGGGSGTGRASYIVTPLEALQTQADADNTTLTNYPSSTSPPSDFAGADACLVFLRAYAEEGSDRSSLDIDSSGADTVTNVACECANTIVILHGPGYLNIPFASHPNVTAILSAHYPGQETGNAITVVLYGRVEPQGRLPYTIANSEADYNTAIETEPITAGPNSYQSYFTEGLAVDYRYFDQGDKPVLYEFGYGMGYTTFQVSNVSGAAMGGTISATPADQPAAPGGNPDLWTPVYTVTASVRNIGERAGSTIAQCYVDLGHSAPDGTPVRQLRGFQKLSREADETQSVSFELTRRDVSYWDMVSQNWVVPSGEMTASVGLSSRNLMGHVSFTLV